MSTRRAFIGAASGCSLWGLGGWSRLMATSFPVEAQQHLAQIAIDESYWLTVQAAFAIDRTWINLNNGGVSPAPRLVIDALHRAIDVANMAPAHTMWDWLEPGVETVREGLARMFGCDPEELAITRNASEALEICIFGLKLERGDEVLTTTHDYPRMLAAWRQRERRDGIVLRTIPLPVSLDAADFAERFRAALTPRTRVIQLCHMTNLTGQILPVREISRLGRAHGCDVLVDGAQAFGQFPFKLSDLDCDYYGTSLHKWLHAPVGTGFLYVRREKINTLWPLMAAPKEMDGDIRKFEQIGTHPAANHNAVVEALAFNEAMGLERKAARLRYLRDRWAQQVARLKGVKLLTSLAPGMACALATFAIDGIDSRKLAVHLQDKRRIIVTPILHPDVQGIRVSPSVCTAPGEVDVFVEELEKVVQHGLPT